MCVTYETGNQLPDRPPDGQDGQQVLMRAGHRVCLVGLAEIGAFDKTQREPRKTAESTGILPPTPMPTTASSEARATKFGAPPAARPKTPAISSVALNEILASYLVFADKHKISGALTVVPRYHTPNPRIQPRRTTQYSMPRTKKDCQI